MQYNLIKPISMNPALENLEYPKDFQDLNVTNDRWIDTFSESSSKGRPRPTTQIYNAYKLWFNFLMAESLLHLSREQYYFLVNILDLLDDLHLNNESKYPDKITLYKRFCAAAARNFQIMACLHHNVTPILGRYSRVNRQLMFSEILLLAVPKWHLTIEDISFMNLLINATRRTSNSIKFIKLKNALQQSVVIPYETSETCPYQKYTNSEELPYKQRSLRGFLKNREV